MLRAESRSGERERRVEVVVVHYVLVLLCGALVSRILECCAFSAALPWFAFTSPASG